MTATLAEQSEGRWWRTMSGYQWFVVAVASAAWLFDTLDQRLFSLARVPALAALMQMPGSEAEVQAFAKVATAFFLVGWGVGGLVMGALGDRYGRARMLTLSILLYSVCTGATAMSRNEVDFAVLRLITGVGIGGVFGLAVALVAETVSPAARLAMLGILQILSTVGNMGAAVIKMGVDGLAGAGAYPVQDSWRILFLIGALPALLAIASFFYLRESDAWLDLKRRGELPKGFVLGPYRELLAEPGQRRNLLIGTLLAVAGVVGLWGVGEYAVDLQDAVFTAHFTLTGEANVALAVAQAKNLAYFLQMAGAAVGMAIFTYCAGRFGRRPAFVGGFLAALILTVFVYAKMSSPQDAYWMMPLMGAAQFSVFAGFAIYLPELFGSRVRGTGVSFAYNIGRFAAAAGSFFSAILTTRVFAGYASPLPLRYSAIVMCSVFVVGLIAAAMAPETKGRPLPE